MNDLNVVYELPNSILSLLIGLNQGTPKWLTWDEMTARKNESLQEGAAGEKSL